MFRILKIWQECVYHKGTDYNFLIWFHQGLLCFSTYIGENLTKRLLLAWRQTMSRQIALFFKEIYIFLCL